MDLEDEQGLSLLFLAPLENHAQGEACWAPWQLDFIVSRVDNLGSLSFEKMKGIPDPRRVGAKPLLVESRSL